MDLYPKLPSNFVRLWINRENTLFDMQSTPPMKSTHDRWGKTTPLILQSGPVLALDFKQVDSYASMWHAPSLLPKKMSTTTSKSGSQLLNIARPTRTGSYHLLPHWTLIRCLHSMRWMSTCFGLSPDPESDVDSDDSNDNM